MEGSPEEISDFFQNNGLKVSDYLKAPEPELPNWHFIVSSVVVVVAVIALGLGMSSTPQLNFALFLIGCLATAWLSVSLQLRFGNAWATCLSFIIVFVILLMAIGYLTPTDALKEIRSINE